MPPKKDKKKTKAKKPKKIRLSVQEPSPRFATGFNRAIPGGIIGNKPGDYTPASFALGGYASRQPPPATPIQTPDQFAIQRSLASQAQVIESIVEEQQEIKRRGRRKDKDKADELGVSVEEYRAMRASERMPPEKPLTETPLKDQFAKVETEVSMPDALQVTMGGGALETPHSNIRLTKKGTPDKRYKAGVIMSPPTSAPPEIGGALFPGGIPAKQQGLKMSPPARIRTPAPDASTSLVGLEGVGDNEVVVQPTAGLQDQGAESGV